MHFQTFIKHFITSLSCTLNFKQLLYSKLFISTFCTSLNIALYIACNGIRCLGKVVFYKMMVYLILCSLPLQYLRFFQLKRWPETYHRMDVDKQYTRYSNQKQLLLYVLGRYFTCFITVKGGLIFYYNIIEDVQKRFFVHLQTQFCP